MKAAGKVGSRHRARRLRRVGLLAPLCLLAFSPICAEPTNGTAGQAVKLNGVTPSAAGVSVCDFGAVGDGETLNTSRIQTAIDQLSAKGGGTLVIPEGVFLSGAIFLKPGVNLRLDEGAVLKGSTNITDYPRMKTRIEGQFTNWIPALVNADQCDHLRITGPGTLDGSGQVFYTAFWNARDRDPKVTNLAVERPRLAFIQNSSDVQVLGIKFKDSGFWNLHLYRCADVLIEKVRFEAPYGDRPKGGPARTAWTLTAASA